MRHPEPLEPLEPLEPPEPLDNKIKKKNKEINCDSRNLWNLWNLRNLQASGLWNNENETAARSGWFELPRSKMRISRLCCVASYKMLFNT